MKEATYDEHCQAVSHLAAVIASDLDRPQSVAQMARTCYISPFHFQRVFQRVAGETCAGFVRRLRLERAAWQLLQSDALVTSIALDAGFCGPEPFSRAFRRHFASTAGEFRATGWPQYSLLSPNGFHFRPSGPSAFVPLSLDGSSTPARLEWTAPLRLNVRRHFGPPHLIPRTLATLASDLDALGVRPRRFCTYAEALDRESRSDRVVSYAGVPSEEYDGPELTRAVVGGGWHLVTEYRGDKNGLGDYWMRFWHEGAAHSGTIQRSGPVFQTVSISEGPDITATIYVPVHGDNRISGQHVTRA